MLIPAAPQIQLQYPLSYFRLLPLCANGNNNAPSGILSPREASSSTWQSWAAAAGHVPHVGIYLSKIGWLGRRHIDGNRVGRIGSVLAISVLVATARNS